MRWILTCLLLLGLDASSARAQEPPPAPVAPAPGDQAAQAQQEAEAARTMSAIDSEAREHFKLGRSFYEAGRFQQAAEEFEVAYRLSARPQLLYNVYVARRDAGGLPSAVEALRNYLAQVPDAPDRVNLEARLSSLEAQVKRQEEQEAARAASERKAAEAEAKVKTRTRTERVRSVVPLVLMGTGGALLLGSAVTGGLALSNAGKLDKECAGSLCPPSEQSGVDATKTLAITTDVLWAVGGAAAVTGLILFLTGALDKEREVPVAFGISPHGISTQLTRRF